MLQQKWVRHSVIIHHFYTLIVRAKPHTCSGSQCNFRDTPVNRNVHPDCIVTNYQGVIKGGGRCKEDVNHAPYKCAIDSNRTCTSSADCEDNTCEQFMPPQYRCAAPHMSMPCNTTIICPLGDCLEVEGGGGGPMNIKRCSTDGNIICTDDSDCPRKPCNTDARCPHEACRDYG